jgi:hypothetical protein
MSLSPTFHHGNGFDMLVAGDFTQHRAIAAADDQHVLCVTTMTTRALRW